MEESGFYDESDGSEFFRDRMRWTNGHAKLVVRVADDNWPDRLMINLSSVSPTGSQLRVLVNGHEVCNGPLSGGRSWFEVLPLANVPPDCVLTIEMISNRFVPSEVLDGSKDDRILGVRVREVRLLSSKTRVRHPVERKKPEPESAVAGREQPRRFGWDPAADTTLTSAQGADDPSRSKRQRLSKGLRKPKPTIAFFSPLPPQKSGVSDYSAFLLEELRKHYSFDLFHDSGYVPGLARADHGFMSCDYRLFDRIAAAKDYHAIVYQMGNSPYHSYMFETLLRHPGLVTLHDFCLPGFHLHYGESRGLGHRFIADELRRWYPEDREAIEDALATWPMGWYFVRECVIRGWHLNRRILDAAQVMVVHSPWCASEAEKGTPHFSGKVVVIPHGIHPRQHSSAERVAVRERFQLPQDALIFGSFGFMNAEKMNLQAIEAFAAIAEEKSSSLFIFVGEEEDGGEARLFAEALGLSSRVRFFGRQPTEAFTALVSVTDVGVNLRLPPTNGETSGALLNLLAAGVPTVVTDVATFSDYPASVVRKVLWETEGGEGLLRAMSDLATELEHRISLGKSAWNYVVKYHKWSEVGEQYVASIERCHQEIKKSRYDGRKLLPLSRLGRDTPETVTRSAD